MSLTIAKTKEEGIFQYCNYGYEGRLFNSYNDCMTNYDKVFNKKKPIKYIIASAVVLGIGYYIYRKFKK